MGSGLDLSDHLAGGDFMHGSNPGFCVGQSRYNMFTINIQIILFLIKTADFVLS